MIDAQKNAVVLLSGGLDSATVLALAIEAGYKAYALSFSYGQRHSWELECAKRVAAAGGAAEHRIANIDLRAFGGSALTAEIDVPRGRSAEEMGHGIPITYVPARNTIFLSFALAWAEVLGSSDIFLGVNALDYSGYPDCRPEYIAAYEAMANLATRAGVEGAQRLKIHSPLMQLTTERAGGGAQPGWRQPCCWSPLSSGRWRRATTASTPPPTSSANRRPSPCWRPR